MSPLILQPQHSFDLLHRMAVQIGHRQKIISWAFESVISLYLVASIGGDLLFYLDLLYKASMLIFGKPNGKNIVQNYLSMDK